MLFLTFEMLCCKGYVRDMAITYGIKVVYEGLARYLEYYLLNFISFKILAVSHMYSIHYLNISEQCSNLNKLHAFD